MLSALLLTVVSFAVAQTIIPSTPDATFPACGLSCLNILNAQTACIPPAAPVTDQFVYDQCFCQSAFLTPLHSTPDGVCDAECPVETDRQLLESWYQNFCAQIAETLLPTTAGATSTSILTSSTDIPTVSSSDVATLSVTESVVVDSSVTIVNPPTTMATVPTTQSVVVVTVTSTNSASLPTTSSQPTSGASSGNGSSTGRSWIDTHWKWILMLAVLIVGLALLAWLAVYLKRRHQRRKDEQVAAASGFPTMREKGGERSSATLEDMFGPHQLQSMTNGYQYTHDQNRALVAVGALGSAIRERSRQRKRDRSERRKANPAVMAAAKATELDGSRNTNAERSRSRKGMKGKNRDLLKETEMGNGRRTPSETSRSRRMRDGERPKSSRLGSSRGVQEKDIERDVDAIEEG